MTHVHDGAEEGITTFTNRGIESLQEFLAEVRTWPGGIRQFLVDEQCDPDMIEDRAHHGHRAKALTSTAYAGCLPLSYVILLI